MANNNPWLALSTYEEKDKDKFKGRGKDVENVLTMLQQSECVVCYAASGDGKSSLINAGVCPAMRKIGMFPIKITFTTSEYEGVGIPHKSDGSVDFDKLILSKIEQSVERYMLQSIEKYNIQDKDEYVISFEKKDKYNQSPIKDNLWWKLRTETIQIPFGEFDNIPILIFDQFEEIFQAMWKTDFFKWLEKFMKDVCPDEIVELKNEYNLELPTQKLFKLLFSMRYEYVGELDYWCSQRTFIPQIMHNRYFLKPFTRNQAISVICSQCNNDISLKMGENADLIVDNILASSSVLSDNDEVPAIVLSLVCYVLFEEWSANEFFSLNSISLNDIIYDYYRSRLHKVGINDIERRVLEEVLISPQNARLRMPVSDSRLIKIGLAEHLKKEENIATAHIVKIDHSNEESYIEFVHDRLVAAISKKRIEERKELNKEYSYKTKKKIGYGVIVFVIIISFFFLTYKSLTNNLPVHPPIVSAPECVVTVDDVSSMGNIDFSNATAINISSNIKECRHRIDCFKNVLYLGYSDLVYAHNADELCFLRSMNGSLDLQFGENVKRVFILYPDSIRSLLCSNKNTHIYIPYGYYERCVSNPAFSNIHFEELSIISTFLKKLEYEVHLQHTHLVFSKSFEIPLWLASLVIFILTVVVTRKYWMLYSKKRKMLYFVWGLFAFILFTIIYLEMYWLGWVNQLNPSYVIFAILMVWYLYNHIDRRLFSKRNNVQKTQYCIIYCSRESKKNAVNLKQQLIENGIKETDIKLDLSIVRHDDFDFELAQINMATSKHRIVVFNRTDLDDFKSYKEMVYSTKKYTYIHPIAYGLENLEDFLLPCDPKFSSKKRGSFTQFPVFYVPDLLLSQEKMGDFIKTLKKKYTPAYKLGCLWPIVITYILSIIISLVIIFYNE